jgi:hypothetical protein
VLGGYGFGQSPFAGLLARVRPGPAPGGGIGGSGMSDEEYRRLLRRLGAAVSEPISEDEVAGALVALRELGAL